MRAGPQGRSQPLRTVVRLGLAGLAAVATTRITGTTRGRWLVGAQAAARWALLPAHVLLPVAVARRWPAAAAVSAGLAGFQLVLTWSGRGQRRPDPGRPGGTSVRLVSANLLLSNPTVRAAGERLLASPVDVLARRS